MKSLSVIVPTYNVEKYIDKCLSSLIVESDDLEVLVIIDGSTDRSSKIALDYQNRYPNIFKVIEKENGHYGSCVNVGLRLAKGRYVKILDSDDSFDKEFVEYLSRLSEITDDLVLTDYVVVDEFDKVTERHSFSFNCCNGHKLKDIVNSDIPMMRHYDLTYRTEVLRKMAYQQTEGISYTDIEWSYLPFQFVSSFTYCPVTVYRYLKGRRGQTVDIEYRKKNMWMENNVVLGIARQYEKCKKGLNEDNYILVRRFLSNYIIQVYFHYLINYRGILDESELRLFDQKLLLISEEIYEAVEDTKDVRKLGVFYYIKDFRKADTKKQFKYQCLDFWTKTKRVFTKKSK